MFGLFKREAKPKERRLKLHDVEATLSDVAHKNFAAHLWQTRWSDGTGKFRLWLPELRDGWDGASEAVLLRESEEVARFALGRRALDFKWRGEVTPEMPLFEIGQRLRLEDGQLAFEGTVEAD